MFYYDDDSDNDNVLSLAQYCKSFNPGSTTTADREMKGGSMSCNMCKNWDGSQCYVNAYDRVRYKLEQDAD